MPPARMQMIDKRDGEIRKPAHPPQQFLAVAQAVEQVNVFVDDPALAIVNLIARQVGVGRILIGGHQCSIEG